MESPFTPQEIQDKTKRYMLEKVEQFGVTAKGVDWKDSASQALRFDRLLLHLERPASYSLLDVGCGLGDLVPVLQAEDKAFDYLGIDFLPRMVELAQGRFSADPRVNFQNRALDEVSETFDFAVASGILNLKMDVPDEEWLQHILRTLDGMHRVTRKGFAFNILTSYVDFQVDRLYYCDPLRLFDHCKRHYSRFVMLDHLYPAYEFTITVLK